MKTNKKSVRRSQKGKWGSVGAPPKKTNWPNRPFTYKQLFENNSDQCELSIRQKVKDYGLNGGQSEVGKCDYVPALVQLESVRQPGKSVGRPSERFVVKEHFDASKMTVFGSTPKESSAPKVKKSKKAKTETVTTVTVTEAVPATAPVNDTPATEVSAVSATEVPASPSPMEVHQSEPAPATEVATAVVVTNEVAGEPVIS